MENNKRDIIIGKALAKLLRHHALKDGLSIDSNGFIPINQVLNHKFIKSNKATIDDIIRIVNNNSKKRFILKEDPNNGLLLIAALQGHSIESVGMTHNMILLDNNNDMDNWPNVLIHGTYRDKLPLILNSGGLSKMLRNHIHLTDKIPLKFNNIINNLNLDSNLSLTTLSNNNAISGIRNSCEIIIIINIQLLKQNSNEIKLYRSNNGVYLTPGNENGVLSKNYFSYIIDYESGLITE